MQSQGDLSSPFCPGTDMPSAAARCQVQQACGKPIGLAMRWGCNGFFWIGSRENIWENKIKYNYIIFIWYAMIYWLVVDLPLWKIWVWVRQLGWWHSQLNGQIKHGPNHHPVGFYTKDRSYRLSGNLTFHQSWESWESGGIATRMCFFFLAGTGEPKRHHSRNPSMAKWLQYSTLGLWDVSGTLALPATTAWTADAAWVELGCAERIPRVGEQLPFETKRCSWLITAELCWNPNFDMLKSSRSIRMMTGWAARNLWYAITEGTKCWASKLERHHQVFHISPVSRALLAAWCSRSEACFWSKIRPQNLRVKP